MRQKNSNSQITKSNLIQATISGSLSVFSFSEISLWFMIIAAITWFLLILKDVNKTESFWIGWFFGIGYFGVNIWWIHISIESFGIPNSLIAVSINAIFVCLLAIYFSIFGILIKSLSLLKIPLLFIAPLIWLLLEISRGYFFTGFPWLVAGYTQIDSPLSALLPLIGAYGVSFVIVSLASFLVFLLGSKSLNQKLFGVFTTFSIVTSSYYLQQIEYTLKNGELLDISIVQGSLPYDVRWSKNSTELIFDHYMELSLDQWDSDILVWPETVFTKPLTLIDPEVELLKSISSRTDTHLILGVPFLEGSDNKVFNSILSVADSIQLYKKRKLVPFGEYFPLREVFSNFYDTLNVPLSDFTKGLSKKSKFFVKENTIGVLICYEIAFASIARSSLPQAELIVNLSNDSWFGKSVAAFQHLQIVRVRAAELERPIIRATNTGISAIIDHKGDVIDSSGLFEAQIISGEVVGRVGSTPYAKIGERGVTSFALMLVLFALAIRFFGYRYVELQKQKKRNPH